MKLDKRTMGGPHSADKPIRLSAGPFFQARLWGTVGSARMPKRKKRTTCHRPIRDRLMRERMPKRNPPLFEKKKLPFGRGL